MKNNQKTRSQKIKLTRTLNNQWLHAHASAAASQAKIVKRLRRKIERLEDRLAAKQREYETAVVGLVQKDELYAAQVANAVKYMHATRLAIGAVEQVVTTGRYLLNTMRLRRIPLKCVRDFETHVNYAAAWLKLHKDY